MLKSSFYCILLFCPFLGYGQRTQGQGPFAPIGKSVIPAKAGIQKTRSIKTRQAQTQQIDYRQAQNRWIQTRSAKTDSPATWLANSIQSFKIQAPNIQLSFEQSSRLAYQVTAQSSDLSITKQNGELLIQSKDFLSTDLFAQALSKKPIIVKISGPSKPVFIGAGHSQIHFSGWKSPVHISSLTGQLKSINTRGDWNVGLQSGSIDMTKHIGKLKTKSFKMKASIQQSQGYFNLQLNEGYVRIKKSTGSVVLTGDQADIQISHFKGDLKAFSRSGAVKASLTPGNIKIQTQTALVRLHVREHGASVKAYTESGKMYVPRYFNKKFEGKSTRVSGRLLSKIKKGEIFVESERGNIYIQ